MLKLHMNRDGIHTIHNERVSVQARIDEWREGETEREERAREVCNGKPRAEVRKQLKDANAYGSQCPPKLESANVQRAGRQRIHMERAISRMPLFTLLVLAHVRQAIPEVTQS